MRERVYDVRCLHVRVRDCIVGAGRVFSPLLPRLSRFALVSERASERALDLSACLIAARDETQPRNMGPGVSLVVLFPTGYERVASLGMPVLLHRDPPLWANSAGLRVRERLASPKLPCETPSLTVHTEVPPSIIRLTRCPPRRFHVDCTSALDR